MQVVPVAYRAPAFRQIWFVVPSVQRTPSAVEAGTLAVLASTINDRVVYVRMGSSGRGDVFVMPLGLRLSGTKKIMICSRRE